jgi:hypothetical protein
MRPNELDNYRATVPDHVVHRALTRETVLLNIRTSTYHTVDETGARFFDVLRQSPSLDVACARLAEEFEQPYEVIAEDMVHFCGDLSERDLISVAHLPKRVSASEARG